MSKYYREPNEIDFLRGHLNSLNHRMFLIERETSSLKHTQDMLKMEIGSVTRRIEYLKGETQCKEQHTVGLKTRLMNAIIGFQRSQPFGFFRLK